MHEWRDLQQDVADQTAVWREYQRIAHRQADIAEALRIYATYLTTSDAADVSTHQLLAAVEQAALAARVQITALTPRPPSLEATELYAVVDVECLGTLPMVSDFLERLAHAPVLLRVDQLRMNPLPGAPQQLTTHVTVSALRPE